MKTKTYCLTLDHCGVIESRCYPDNQQLQLAKLWYMGRPGYTLINE